MIGYRNLVSCVISLILTDEPFLDHDASQSKSMEHLIKHSMCLVQFSSIYRSSSHYGTAEFSAVDVVLC